MRTNSQYERGQSSVEYALVLLAFLAVAVALFGIWHAAHEGTLLDVARRGSSHNAQDGLSVGLAQDLASY